MHLLHMPIILSLPFRSANIWDARKKQGKAEIEVRSELSTKMILNQSSNENAGNNNFNVLKLLQATPQEAKLYWMMKHKKEIGNIHYYLSTIIVY